MARSNESASSTVRLERAWDYVLAGRPLLALAVVWLTTAGHTMNFREMYIGQGWVPAQGYSLHTAYLVAVALVLLAGPALGRHFSCRGLAQAGLAILAASSFVNGIYVHADFSIFMAGRVMAGIGAGLVINFAPRLLDRRWENPTTWASILLPVTGPALIAAATMLFETSDWPWGFLVVGAAALVSLVVLMSMTEEPELPPPILEGSPTFLPFLAIGSAALVYCLHWGQLHGWLESSDIAAAAALGAVNLALALLLIYPGLDFRAVKEGWMRLLLFFFGGLCQFFHGTSMNIYGGLVLNFSSLQRSWLIWSLPLGVATSLVAARTVRRRWRVSLGLPGAIAGLLVLAGGMFAAHQRTIDWPYWQITNVIDLNWFQAPQHWELAPARFFTGLGIGLFMISMDTMVSPNPEREERVRPLMLVMQFYGGGIGIALLVNCFLIGHPIQYSYTADRDYIQAEEFAQRRAVLRDALSQAGDPAPDRKADVLLYRTVNYEADNLVFAEIYATFTTATLGLASLCLGLVVWNWVRPPPRGEVP
jgi:MFS family permease